MRSGAELSCKGVAPADCCGAVSVAHEPLPIRLMHSPNAHMTAQGSALIRSGAMPAATSALQFIMRPTVTIASAAATSTVLGRMRMAFQIVAVARSAVASGTSSSEPVIA